MAISAVIVDSREPEWVRMLTFGNAPTSVAMLNAGDLMIGCDDDTLLMVERKTADDFLHTLRDDRLFPQLVKLRQMTQWAYLAICGTLAPGPGGRAYADGRETGWQWASVAGTLLTVQEIGVHVLFVASDDELEAAIIRLAARERGPVRVKPARDTLLMGEGECVLTSLPGIGPDRAQALLDYCSTPAWALAYLSNEQWTGPTAPGVGDGTRRRVRQALGLPEGEILAIVTQDDEKEVSPYHE